VAAVRLRNKEEKMKEMLLITILPMSIAMTACGQYKDDLFPRRHYWDSGLKEHKVACSEGESEEEEDWWWGRLSG